MAILKTIRFLTTAGAPDYFTWGDLDKADYYVITDDGKAYAISAWGERFTGSGRPGWSAAEVQCTEEGRQSNNIWRRLSGATMSGMESDYFPAKKELVSAIENGSITLKDKSRERQAFKNTMKDVKVTMTMSRGTDSLITTTTGAGESSGCLAIIAAASLSAATLTSMAFWLRGLA